MNFLQAFEENSLLAVAYVASAKEKGKRGEGGERKTEEGDLGGEKEKGRSACPLPLPLCACYAGCICSVQNCPD